MEFRKGVSTIVAILCLPFVILTDLSDWDMTLDMPKYINPLQECVCPALILFAKNIISLLLLSCCLDTCVNSRYSTSWTRAPYLHVSHNNDTTLHYWHETWNAYSYSSQYISLTTYTIKMGSFALDT